MKIFSTLIVLLLISGNVLAQTSTDKFRFQADKVPVGTVYHYVKTNIDGTHPEYVSQYVASASRLEAFKFHPKEEPAALVVAEMDWSIASARSLESWRVVKSGERRVVGRLYYNSKDQNVEVSIPSLGRPSQLIAIKYLPFHVYNFDFGSLNFAFRHLIDPTAPFTVGVADPTFKADGDLFIFRGTVEITYQGEETRNKVVCRKYRIDGPGLDNKGGFIWVNKLRGHIEDMEIQLADNPDWQTFKFKLLRTERFTRAQWTRYMKAQF